MKSRMFTLLLISFLFFGVFSNILIDICSAEDKNYNISIIDVSYEFVKTVGSGTQIFEYFNINVILRNFGSAGSEDITIELVDEDNLIPLTKTYEFAAGESKTFIYDDYVISGTGDHPITINFYPTNNSVEKTQYNSGSRALVVNKEVSSGENSTPSFEFITLLVAIAAILLFRKKIKR